MSESFRVFLMFASMIGGFVLLFIGFRDPTKELKKADGPHKIPKEIIVRSTILLVLAVLFLGIFAACSHYDEYQNGLCTLEELFLANIERIAIKFGWVVLFPWLFSIFTKNRSPKENEKSSESKSC